MLWAYAKRSKVGCFPAMHTFLFIFHNITIFGRHQPFLGVKYSINSTTSTIFGGEIFHNFHKLTTLFESRLLIFHKITMFFAKKNNLAEL